MPAGPPSTVLPLPPVVADLANGRATRAVWLNGLGVVTFEVGRNPDRVFIKWAPAQSNIDFGPEIARLEWAVGYAAVPKLLDSGADERGSWLLSEALPGENAVTDRWRAEPRRAVHAIGEGLRTLHEALPVADCPFSWSVAQRLATVPDALRRPATWHADHRGLTPAQAVELLSNPPAIDKLVVCQGDASAPNTLIDDDGRCSGHVDLGALGVADRWADLAVASWSTTWNYGPGWDDELLAAYGVSPDRERLAYYRLLWDLSP